MKQGLETLQLTSYPAMASLAKRQKKKAGLLKFNPYLPHSSSLNCVLPDLRHLYVWSWETVSATRHFTVVVKTQQNKQKPSTGIKFTICWTQR